MAARNGAIVAVGVSRADDPQAAAEEALRRIDPAETAFLLAHDSDPARLAALADRLDGRAPLYGCTSAGQITPAGYESDALLVLAFPRAHFRCAAALAAPLGAAGLNEAAAAARAAEEALERPPGWSCLGLLMSDGLSRKEDTLAAAIAVALEGVPIFGGSAGDDLSFARALVLHEGELREDAGLILLISTDLNWRGLSFDHFLPAGPRLVITGAEPDKRLVHEINGSPAAPEYARLIGCKVSDLSLPVFAKHPLLARHRDAYHVRAIHRVCAGESLALLGAIDEGLVLTLGRSADIVAAARAAFAGLGRPDFILGFDCVLRRLEIDQAGLTEAVSAVLRANRVLGFNTFGEQHHGMHVNQTFVGVAFSRAGAAP